MGIEEVLLIGGAAGVGKSTTGWEVSSQLTAAGVAHWHLEGDVLDAAWPRPAGDESGAGLTEKTLRAMAGVFASAGYTRLVFVQTYSLMDRDLIRRALGQVRMRGVLLTATEETRIARLSQREIGSELERHVVSGARMAAHLAADAPRWVHRVATDGRPVADIAAEVVGISGWPASWPEAEAHWD